MGRASARAGLQRDVTMLPPRRADPLRGEHGKSRDQPRAGLPRLDDVVDVAARSRARSAAGSPACAISLRKTISIAPSGPITAISAVGQARLTSPRMCLLDMTS